jgi:hypothetical protein
MAEEKIASPFGLFQTETATVKTRRLSEPIVTKNGTAQLRVGDDG